MNTKKIDKIFADTAYVRMGGTKEELRCAEYIQSLCTELGVESRLEEFDVEMADMKKATLLIDGKEITCKGYFGCGSHEVEAPFYYLRHDDAYSLAGCKGKIVMIDGYMGYWKYQDILEHGAIGFITHDGDNNYVDFDIDQRELRAFVHKGNKIPGVNINTKHAIELIKNNPKTAKIVIEQDEYKGKSRNVIADLPGEVKETIVMTAHYDSTSLSTGAYDNMSGSIGILGILEKFAKEPHHYGLRFVWCGSEERGLLGSKAYVEQHENDELKDVILNVNLDMIGCIMGYFVGCATAEEKLCNYIEYLACMEGMAIKTFQDVYSSDSTPFADKGIPAVSFARRSPNNCATIHNSYDTLKLMSASQMVEDIDFLNVFVGNMANAKHIPVAKEMPENMKEKLDIYLCRKRDKK